MRGLQAVGSWLKFENACGCDRASIYICVINEAISMRVKITYNEIHQALNEWANKELSSKNIKFADKNEFIQYLNYTNKLISHKPRIVSFSKSFEVSDGNKQGLGFLVEKLKNGQNVNAHLSKLTGNAKHIDYLLDGYGVKHFHLGISEKDNFVERTGELALAFITQEEAFFITSKEHGDETWYGKDVLEIIHKERPDLIKHAKVKGVCGTEPKITSVEDIKLCRQNQLSIAIELDDRTVYFQNDLGTSLAGYSSTHIFEENRLCITIMNYINEEIIPSISRIIHNFTLKIDKFIPSKRIEICLSIIYVINTNLVSDNIYFDFNK